MTKDRKVLGKRVLEKVFETRQILSEAGKGKTWKEGMTGDQRVKALWKAGFEKNRTQPENELGFLFSKSSLTASLRSQGFLFLNSTNLLITDDGKPGH
jgi:hypothetical protein